MQVDVLHTRPPIELATTCQRCSSIGHRPARHVDAASSHLLDVDRMTRLLDVACGRHVQTLSYTTSLDIAFALGHLTDPRITVSSGCADAA